MSLTKAGREVVAEIEAVEDPAPEAYSAMSEERLKTFHDILARLTARRD